MKIKVTKAQIVRALKTEPLKSGAWVHYDEDMGEGQNFALFKNKTGCAVCAVGSILDCSIGTKSNMATVKKTASRLVTDPTFDGVVSLIDDDDVYIDYSSSARQVVAAARKVARKGYYLSALSSLFEELSSRSEYTTNQGLANYKLVNILVNFVKAEFPNRLTLDTKKNY